MNWAPFPHLDRRPSASEFSTRAITRAISHAGATVSLFSKRDCNSGRPGAGRADSCRQHDGPRIASDLPMKLDLAATVRPRPCSAKCESRSLRRATPSGGSGVTPSASSSARLLPRRRPGADPASLNAITPCRTANDLVTTMVLNPTDHPTRHGDLMSALIFNLHAVRSASPA